MCGMNHRFASLLLSKVSESLTLPVVGSISREPLSQTTDTTPTCASHLQVSRWSRVTSVFIAPSIVIVAGVFRAKVSFTLFLHCPKEELKKRLLARGESSGRADDNVETVLKRFDTFEKESLPVVECLERLGMVSSI